MRLNKKNYLQLTKQSSFIITISGLVSKILAAIYRIPYQNLVGDRGFFAYQQIYPLLAIITTLSLTALPNVVASLSQTTEKKQLGHLFQLQLLVSAALSFVLIVCHQWLANSIGSPALAPAIIISGLVLLTVPFTSFYRGLAQADDNMVPTAVSQVLEQTIRIAIIIAAALCYYCFHWTIYLTANVAAAGNVMASVVILLYFYFTSPYSLSFYFHQKFVPSQVLKKLGLSSFVYIFYALYLLLFQLIDALVIKNSLIAKGMSEALAETTKGIYDRGQPLLQFGLIFSTALFTSFLPQLTRYYAVNSDVYRTESQSFFTFIYYFNVTLTAGFLAILPLMNVVLFKDNRGWLALSCYVIIISLASLIQFFHQQLFIEQHSVVSLLFLTIGLGLKIMLTVPMTMQWSIVGSALATVLPLMVVLGLYAYYCKIDFKSLANGKFYVILVIMVLTVTSLARLLPHVGRMSSLITLLIATLSGLALFVALAIFLRVFPQKLWSYLPINTKKW
ncbi:oligosaccharide flippase family protein [Streptococcus halichoeri]|uniref:oligosaccharide flippase family protein n=1 Tax=Streptococcus halichoeri TaxID=254785 RepID=UPI00135727F5|nr:oligosaccharide flippase family protein [Streptococcus halichoeri]